MPSQVLLPNGESLASADWTGTYVSLQSLDGDTSYRGRTWNGSVTTKTFRETLDALDSTAEAITSVTKGANNRASQGGSMGHGFGLYYAGVNALSNIFYQFNAYTTVEYAQATAPGGAAWTPAIINSTEIYGTCSIEANDGSFIRVTYMYVTVVYTQPDQNLIRQILTHVGPITGLSLLHMPAISDIIFKASRIRILPQEFASAVRAYANYRHPRTV